MTTVINAGTNVTPRDLDLFRTLAIARVLDSEEVRIVCRFSSLRRTNRRLLKLVRAKLLRRWFLGNLSGGQKALYGLSPTAATLIGQSRQGLVRLTPDSIITTSEFLTHQQAVNQVFLHVKFRPLADGFSCKQWLTFREPLSPSVPLMPDGYFELVREDALNPMFLELDLGTERAPVWRRKVELYLKFAINGDFERLFGPKRFRVLVVLPSERRLEAIRRTIVKRTNKLFWLSTQDELMSKGILGPIWLRPAGDERIPPV
jgi:hypothetical protein